MNKAILILLLLNSAASFGQGTRSISGNVNDVNSQPIAGVSIHILNTNSGTTSDLEGKFVIPDLVQGKFTLEISAVGFVTMKKEITMGEASDNNLSIQLAASTTQLDAVMVTAQKFEEEVQTIPSGISALSTKQVQQYRLWNLRDITAIVPNLYSADPGDNRNVTSIRGITSTSYDPAVATYIDGVNQFSLDTYIVQLFDVQRIEVLRGPQGSLYGRNAMGGVINIVTQPPTNTTKGFAELTIGNYGQQRYGFGFKTPLIRNKLFFGASGVYDQIDGYYTNQLDNSHFDKKNSYTGNYYLRYIASPAWAFTLNVKHNSNRNNGAFPLTGTVQGAFKNPYTVNQNAVATMVDDIFNGSLTTAYSGSALNFTSQTTYQSNYRYYQTPIDGDFSPIDGVTIINDYGTDWNKVKVFTQEFKFTSPASSQSPLKWTAGSYLYYQDVPVKQATRFGKDAGYLGIPDSQFSTINTSTSTNSGIAFFGQASYRFQNKIEFTGGLRYDHEQKETKARAQYQHDPNPNPIFDILPDTSATVSYNAISPKATLSYILSDHNLFYGTYSKGFRTGGLTPVSADPSQAPLRPYKPEYSNNFEIGVKNTFLNNRLKVNLAAFHIEVTDAQIPTLVLPAAVTVIKNAGSLTSQGIELELAATPAKGIQIEYNFGTTKATYNSLYLSKDGQNVDFSGNRQLFTPQTTSMVALQYQSGTGSKQKLKFVVRGEWMYLGDQYFDLANSIKQSGYSLFNTRFGINYKNYELMFWGRNLSETQYIAYAYDFGATHLGNPRTMGVTFRVAF